MQQDKAEENRFKTALHQSQFLLFVTVLRNTILLKPIKVYVNSGKSIKE